MNKGRKIELIFITIFTALAILSYVLLEISNNWLIFYFAGIIILLLMPGILFIYLIPNAFPFFTGTTHSPISNLLLVIIPYLINIALVFFIGYIARLNNEGKKRKVKISVGTFTIIIAAIILGSFFIESSENVDSCSTYTVDWDKNQCLIRIAIRKDDLSICNLITKESQSISNKTSQNECYTGIAGKRHDISVCDKIDRTFEVLRCYSRVAIYNNDRSICDLIPDDSYATKELKRQCKNW
ncbi:MAG: hypothetical protein U5L76_05420 [Patescibacteria group bacterium]|nr:hypothetical protein [Patescibacteria group bacterium]